MQNLTWWQRATIYEIYPRSFQDSNGDGIGDLCGILERLDYLVSLGIDAIWISPVYPSPMADFGYDVADYCGIDPIFGTMADFDQLLAEVHRRGLKLILDFVPNHTSDQHPWFLESRSSQESPKRDWYLWRDEPNNWLSNFGGSGWTRDEATGQFYYHSFLKQQPDLNWRNTAVQQAMFDAMRFWLERGVDGFRIDVIWLMIKDDQFRDNPPNPGYRPGQPSNHRQLPLYNSNRPEVHELVTQMRSVIDEFPDRALIGEIYLPIHQLMTYYGTNLNGANLPFNFQLLQCPWNAESLKRVISDYYGALPKGAWPNWVLGNHDNARIATRVGKAQAAVAVMLLMTLPGTLTLYYGEELGMTNVPVPPDRVQDPAEKNEPGIGQGRDPERSPMPWDGSPNGGFTSGRPWLPVGKDHDEVNVANLEHQATSILNLYRTLIQLRREKQTLVAGKIDSISAEGNLLRYQRNGLKDHMLVLLNLGNDPIRTEVSDGAILASTSFRPIKTFVGGLFHLLPAEGVLIELDR